MDCIELGVLSLTCFSTPLMTWCSWAMYLKECRGTTLSSWSAVSNSMDGYCTLPGGTAMLCRGEYLQQAHDRHVTDREYVT